TDELGLRDVVRFVGNQDNVEEWMATFDLFALPSFGEEGVPQAIMQAMACGQAVISTGVGAIQEAELADRTGLIIPKGDTAALVSAISRLVENDALREDFARAGLAHARANFGIDDMLDRMEAAFRLVIGRG